ncbi:GtrA family protein [Prescottella agglutinans]|uniref:GtrA family protein n=2 Tax=Prescottella agglutinans TaxID=1644129 RepID=UPI003D965D56
MQFSERIVGHIPDRWLARLLERAEMVKFLVVGAITFVATVVVFFGLKWTVLADKAVTANVLAVLVATILSYVLNREWSFAERGRRPRHHEAALYFTVAGIGVAINQIPLGIARYVFDLRVPHVSLVVDNVSDFVSGSIIGTLMATAFRWWAMRRFVFPDETHTGQAPDEETVEAPERIGGGGDTA